MRAWILLAAILIGLDIQGPQEIQPQGHEEWYKFTGLMFSGGLLMDIIELIKRK